MSTSSSFFRGRSWKTEYERAIGEPDKQKLITAIHAVEDALFVRWQELGNDRLDKQERDAMKEAAHELLRIKVNKLGWSDPGK